MAYDPDYLCDNPICAAVLTEQLEARKADGDEIERLRGRLEQVHDLLEEVAEMLPSGRAWGLVRAALEMSVSAPTPEGTENG